MKLKVFLLSVFFLGLLFLVSLFGCNQVEKAMNFELEENQYKLAELLELMDPETSLKETSEYADMNSINLMLGKSYSGPQSILNKLKSEEGIKGAAYFRDKKGVLKIVCIYYQQETPVLNDPLWLANVYGGSEPSEFILETTINGKKLYLSDNSWYGPEESFVQIIHTYEKNQFFLLVGSENTYYIAYLTKGIIDLNW